MSNEKETRNARANMELAKKQSERTFGNEQRLPRRFRLYDKIKDHVSLKAIDAVIIITSILIVILLLFGAKKIPELMRGAGKGVRAFKDGMKETTIDEEESSKNTKEQES